MWGQRNKYDQLINIIFFTAVLRLLQPMKGVPDKEVVLQLENRDLSGSEVISRHITHVLMFFEVN